MREKVVKTTTIFSNMKNFMYSDTIVKEVIMIIWFEFKNKNAEVAEIFIYEEIARYPEWGMTAKNFISALQSVTAETIHLHINSPGGDVFEGNAIFNALKNSGKTIITFIDGLAASMASLIALTGSKVYMAENAIFMIHNPWTCSCGDENDLGKAIEMLQKIKSSMINVYTAKTGKSSDEISTMMDDETWLDATEAIEQGFADEIFAEMKVAAKFDLGKYNPKQPEKLKNYRTIQKNTITQPKIEEGKQMEAILKLLGVTTEAEALVKINALKAAGDNVEVLEKQLKALQLKETEKRIDALVTSGKLTAGQKLWALSLADKNPESFEAFVKPLEEKPATEIYTETEAVAVVDKAIADKKVLPSQKNALVKAGVASKEALDEILTNGVNVTLDNMITIPQNNGAEEEPGMEG
jgi:ATP-dependent Clp endopeptidase proteolytic subunit ClpP